MGRAPLIRRAKNIVELKEDFKAIRSTTAGDVRFSAETGLFIAEKLVSIEQLLDSQHKILARQQNGKPKRKPTEWQRFFAAGMKAGKSPASIADEWRKRSAR